MFAASTALGRNGVILPMEADALDLSSYWPSLLSGDGQSWYALTHSIAFDAVGDVLEEAHSGSAQYQRERVMSFCEHRTHGVVSNGLIGEGKKLSRANRPLRRCEWDQIGLPILSRPRLLTRPGLHKQHVSTREVGYSVVTSRLQSDEARGLAATVGRFLDASMECGFLFRE
ncbi:hypothetical protein PG996_011297 [Apiospora saccharicola]|uniref:Uncharacterized protein n=1 Tax=Apiospora saccharicola TaxID=335842 RepID=A0ABR1UEQ3_9PEZI